VVVCLDSVGPWIVVFLAVDLVVVVSISVVFCIVVGTVVLSIACGVDPDHVVEVPGVDRDVGSAIKDPQYYNILNQC
jgi:Na+/glutamate symporter